MKSKNLTFGASGLLKTSLVRGRGGTELSWRITDRYKILRTKGVPDPKKNPALGRVRVEKILIVMLRDLLLVRLHNDRCTDVNEVFI